MEKIEFVHIAYDDGKERDREEIARKTAEYEKLKAIEVVPFGVSGQKEFVLKESDNATKTKKEFYNEIDIACQKFGKLTAVKRCPTRDMTGYWVFTCDCGARITAERKRVQEGLRTSCDKCKTIDAKPKSKTVDLTGRVFGRLTVIEKVLKKYKSGTEWVCKCECGSVVNSRAFDLENGRRKQCRKCATKEQKAQRERRYEGDTAKRTQDKAKKTKENGKAHAGNNRRVLEIVG